MAEIVQTRELEILHPAFYQKNLDLNPEWFTGDPNVDITNENLLKLQAGVFVTIDEEGYVKLADGASAVKADAVIVPPKGFLYENLPGLASRKVSVTGAPSVIKTVQVVEEDIKPGDPLYIGTGENAGLLTKTKGSSTVAAAIALTGNSATDKAVVVELI